MKVHVARDALHANMLGLSEPRVDARVPAYAGVSVCTHVISACAHDKELTHSPTRIQGLSECTICFLTNVLYKGIYVYFICFS